MSNETDKVDYFNEHIAYELKMLRHTLNALSARQPQRKLDWNAMFEAFGTHARNLYHFQTNDDHAQNFKTQDFADFRARKTDTTIGAFQRLDIQLFHLAKRRPKEQGEKANLSDAQKVSEWIEAQFKEFIDKLAEPYRSQWNWKNADPNSDDAFILNIEPQTATSHITSTSWTLDPRRPSRSSV